MQTSSHRHLAGAGVLWATSLLVLTAPVAQAQDMSIGGLGAASAISSSMSGQGMASSAAAMRQARGAGGRAGMGNPEGDGPDVMGGAGGEAGAGPGAATTTTTTTITTTTAAPDVPLRWSQKTGEQLLSELMAGGYKAPPTRTRTRRSSRAQSNYSRRVTRMTAAQRKRLVMAKYQVAPRGWLAHYLKEDRYKVTSGVWKFVTTPNDPFYYAPSAAAMMRKPAGDIIGFYSWQDAMLAGYRPDPITKPAPGAQLAQLARLSRGPMLARYIEYVYTGQIRPDVFNYNYNYTMQVARTVLSHSHTRPHVGATVNQVIGATIGQGSLPQAVGADGVVAGVAPATVTTTALPDPNLAATTPAATPPMGLGDTGGDKRTENFEEGKRRFGNLAAR